MVVGTNQHGYVFGGYSGEAWSSPSSNEWVHGADDHFIFRLAAPGLGAEAWDAAGTATYLQLNNDSFWPTFGVDLRFGYDGALGTIDGYCKQSYYQAPTNAVCGGGVGIGQDEAEVGGLGVWGATESEMEMWYAL